MWSRANPAVDRQYQIRKKVLALESEHKSFNKAKSGTQWKLQEYNRALSNNNEYISYRSSDYEAFQSRISQYFWLNLNLL